MNENDLSAELLKRAAEQGGGGDDASAQITNYVIRQDRRRIRILSGVIIGAWLLAALLIPAVLLPMWAKLKGHAGTTSITPEGAMQGLAIVSTFIATVSTLASLLAAVSTVWLVLTVRRSTLNQINIGLAGVTAQLKQLSR
jgi:hypothetical protein